MAPLGIIAGGGPLPLVVAKAAVDAGRSVFVCALEGMGSTDLEAFPHEWVTFGSVGRILKRFSAANCREVIMIGHVTRPGKKKIIPDLGALRNAVALAKAIRGGDNHLLSGIADFLETKDFVVVGAHEVAPDLLIGEGQLGALSHSKNDIDDIAKGFEVLAALGRLDIGQATVVCKGHVLAVEAAEGTDGMLKRVAELRRTNGSMHPGGVLIKGPKPGQDMRVDMPVIGATTIKLVADAGLSGIVVQANGVLCPDRGELSQIANDLGIFVEGHQVSDIPSA